MLFDSLTIDAQFDEAIKLLIQSRESDIDICKQISTRDQILSSKHNKSIVSKAMQIERMLEKSRSMINERGTNLHSHLDRAAQYLLKINSFPKFVSATLLKSFEDIYYRECWKYLLHSQVELAYYLNEQLDPQFGWLDFEESEQENPEWASLTNPFISIKFDTHRQGTVSRIEYFPRKLLLLDCEPSHFFSLSPVATGEIRTHTIVKSSDIESSKTPRVPPFVARRQLDLMALRFDEKVPFGSNHSTSTVRKTIYFKSMLGAFMPNSTTGYSFEFWLEESPEDINELYLIFHHTVLMPNQRDLISMRPLLPLAGEGQLHYLTEDALMLRSEDLSGGLSGLRLIEGSSHFVLDYRFARTIEQLTVQCGASSSYETKVHIAFSMKASSVLTFDQIQTMYFCIY